MNHEHSERHLPLVVDLDNTLLRTDTLWEGFFTMLRHAPWKLLFFPLWLSRGRLHVKKQLAPYSLFDSELFPRNKAVLDVAQNAHAMNRPVYLASAAYKSVAENIGQQFSFFTEIFSSTDEINLKGRDKADLLIDRFGEGHFDYIGDSSADLPVWRVAETALVVAAEPALEKSIRSVNPRMQAISPHLPVWRDCLRALRPQQWIKNTLLFVPLFLAHAFNVTALAHAMIAFISFSLCASAIYVLNDLCDLGSDRRHPTKRYRPFASGTVPLSTGSGLFLVSLVLSFCVSLFLPRDFLICLGSYFVLTCTYTLYCKRCLFLDVVVLACLYVLRLVSGAAAIGSGLSHWLMAFGIFAFLGLALLKRIGDLVQLAEPGELPGRAYFSQDKSILEMMAACSAFISVVVVALYIDSLQALSLYSQPTMLWPVCLVLIYWFGRMLLLTHRGELGDDPVRFAVNDMCSYCCFAVVVFLVFLAV